MTYNIANYTAYFDDYRSPPSPCQSDIGVVAIDLLPYGQLLADNTAFNSDGTRDRWFEMGPFNYDRLQDGHVVFPTDWGLAWGRLRTDLPLHVLSIVGEPDVTIHSPGWTKLQPPGQ